MARPHIVVFGKPDWDGYKANIYSTILDLSDRKGHGELGTENWNDEINSFEIKSGIWKIYEHHSRGGKATPELGPGRYRTRDFGFPEDSVTGLEVIRETEP